MYLLVWFILLMGSMGASWGQGVITNLLTLTAPPPPSVTSLSTTIVGNRGNATYYYWVVANYPGGKSAVSPSAIVISAPNTLSGGNYVRVNWNSQAGASSYDLLRTTTATVPNGNCACAVTTALAATTYNDIGGALGAYTVTSQGGAITNCSIDNITVATPTVNCSPYSFASSGVTSLTGTANQIAVNPATGPVVVSLPAANILFGTTILGYGTDGSSFGGTAAYVPNTYGNNSVVQIINTFPTTNALPTGLDIQVWMDPTSASVANLTGGINNAFWGGTAASPGGYLYGSSSQAAYYGTVGSLGTMVGLNAIVQSIATGGTNAGTVTDGIAVSGLVFTSGGGTIVNGYSFKAHASAINRATSAITNYYAFYSTTAGKNSGATITNTYGLYLQDQTEGTTSNYGIFTGKGINRLGDTLTIVPTVADSTAVFKVLRNDAATTVFNIDTTNQCIVIGSSTCSTALTVTGGDFLLSTDGRSLLSAAGTLYIKPSITNTDQYIQVAPTGTGTVTGFKLLGQVSTGTGTRTDFLQSGVDTIIRNQTLGAGAQGAITLEQNGNVRMKVFASTGNIAINTTTDDGTNKMQVNGGVAAITLKTTVVAVSGLGTCNAGVEGTRWAVNDALAPAALAIVVGGGSAKVPVYCNGTNWIVL